MLIGHDDLARDMQKLADEHRLAHGYLFFGPPRVGKFLFAESFAHYLERGVFSPTEGVGPKILGDALFIAPDAEGTIGIDAVRAAQHFLSQMPNRSKYRAVVVRDAEQLTAEAQNAFLKISEEPSPSGLVILIATDSDSLLPTVQSRFQKIYVPGVRTETIVSWLTREWKAGKTEAEQAAREARGAPGLAWALLHDEKLQKGVTEARKFLRMDFSERKQFIKELVDEETFQPDKFLETILLARGAPKQEEFEGWHTILELRRQM